MKIGTKEFEGNVMVTISEREVRIWVCREGVNVFRFKALGKVYEGQQDITVTGDDYGNGIKKIDQFAEIRFLHDAVLKKFDIKSFSELDTPEKQGTALNYIDGVAKKILKRKGVKH